ncbi:CmcI family methyltransferase [Oceanisphaera sediminis]|uniref:CmcI family methyltransferase n=1 Tax=Oceanisphaera sediminis TaxID=981381 RepID=A0ABP7E7N0_9GAMM
MKITLDTENETLFIVENDKEKTLPLYSKEAFETISRHWVKVGWNQKYTYTFSWMGRPIIQLPEDMLRIQEVIFALQPELIIETGVAHGGSLIFYSSLCKAMEKGRVVGIDIEIRPHNRSAIEAHPLSDRITLIEGSSTAPEVVDRVHALAKPGETVLVILDSNHSYQHVMDELNTYAPLVTPGSYIVATDGIMLDLTDVPRGYAAWHQDNPARAALDFVASHEEFTIEQPSWPFNESELNQNITHWPHAWIRRNISKY